MTANSEGVPGRPGGECESDEDRRRGFDLWIEAGRGERHYWLDLWRYRELFFVLAWRDVSVRYKQSVAGVLWALIPPFASMVIMTFIFGRVASLPSVGTAPYAIMVFAAMLPWQFFANALSTAGQSLVGNASMISKVYFPRLVIPASSVLVSLVDFLVTLVILCGLMVWYQFVPSWRLLTLPIFTLLAMLTALGGGLFITALMVRYRDFRFLIQFIVQFGMYLSPVAYSTEVVRKKLGETLFQIYSLNPMVCVIDGFRWAILGEGISLFSLPTLISFVVAILSVIGGVAYFRKTERSFADVI